MDKGYIKFHRRIEENVFLMKDNNAYIVFTKLLLMVGKEKGEWAGGRKQLSERVNLREGTLYDTLKRLESQQLIWIQPNIKYSVIGICNWHKYQAVPNRLNLFAQPPANSQPTASQHSNKNKKKNIYKRDVDKKATISPSSKDPPASKTSAAYIKFKQTRKALNL